MEELRKALDAELAQSVEPDFYAACAEHNGGWIPLPGYSNETVSGVKSLILESARKEGWKGTIEGRLFSLGWQVMPVYLHPPQPQATTPVPEGYALVPIEPTEAMVDAYLAANTAYWLRTDELPKTDPSRWRQGTPSDATAESYRAMINAAQGEKP